MSGPHIVLFGNFGIGNLGNDSTLEAALVAIRRHQPEARLTCVCTGPQVVAEQYGVPTVPVDSSHLESWQAPRSRVRRLLTRLADEVVFWLKRPRWLRSTDQFIIVGTGSLDDMGVRPWGAPYDLVKWCGAARLAGRPVVFLSVGAGPMEDRLNRFLMLWALRLGTHRSYRDQVSKDYLDRVGFNTTGDLVRPDLVFGLPTGEGERQRPVVAPPRVVGLGVMGYYGWKCDERTGQGIYAGYVAKLKRFVAWLLSEGFSIRLLTGQLPVDQRPVDELLEFVRTEGQAEWVGRVCAERIETIGDLFAQIAQTDLVVATRYHNVVCALMLGRPVISLGYAKKNDILLADMGLQAYCQHVETFSVERLIEQFETLAGELGAASARIQEVNRRFRQELDDQYAAILQPSRPAEPATVTQPL